MAAGRQARLINGGAARADGLPALEGAPAGLPAASSAQRLAYIADMALELKSMAEQADCPTLTGLLELAHREARLRQRLG